MANPRDKEGTSPDVVNYASVGVQIVTKGGKHTFNIHAPTPRPEPRKSNLPPRRHDFVGRETELAELHRLLTSGAAVALDQGPTPPSGLTGLGGVGKSTLATEYGYRHLGEYEHVCWVDAEGTAITGGIAALADDPLSLGLPADIPTPDKARAVLARLERNGPHLLILDNVSEPDSYPKLLPQTGAARVILTTRRTDLHGVRRLVVEVLPEDDALRLMLGELQVSEPEGEAARQLCRDLGCLTLAVAVACRLLETRQRTPSALLALVQEKGPLGLPETRRAKDVLGTLPSVERLFDASVELLDEADPVDAHARRLLWVGGWFAPVEIPSETFFDAGARLAGAPVEDDVALAALERLVDLGLVQVDERGWPRLHRIVVAYAREREPEGTMSAVLAAFAEVVTGASPSTHDLVTLGSLAPHLRQAVARLKKLDSENHFRIVLRLAQFYSASAYMSACAEVVERFADSCEPSGWRAALLYTRAGARTALGDLEGGKEDYYRVLSLREQDMGCDEENRIKALLGVAQVHLLQGAVDEAWRACIRAMELHMRLPETHRYNAIESLAVAANILLGTGHAEDAYFLFELVLAMKKKQRYNAADVGMAHYQVGEALVQLHRHLEALTHFSEAVGLQRSALGDHRETVMTLKAIGLSSHRLGWLAEALQALRSALEMVMRVSGQNDGEAKELRALIVGVETRA